MPRKSRKHLLSKDEMVTRLTNEINAGLGKRVFQRAHSAVFLEALHEVVLSSLRDGKGLRLGFITFEVRDVQGRTRFDPKEKKHYPAPPHKAVKALLPLEIRRIGKPKGQPDPVQEP